MRLVLTTIILTMLAQPVWAYSVETLVQCCTTWKNSGFKETFTLDEDGAAALACASYMKAFSDLGEQNCKWSDVPEFFKWNADPKQLTQYFLNQAEKKPEFWHISGYKFLLGGSIGQFFPCKE